MAGATPNDPALRTPTVLVLLVAHDAAGWIADCLRALAAQSYPRMGVLAVDNASTDGTRQILEQSLGAGRVLEDLTGAAASRGRSSRPSLARPPRPKRTTC